MLLMHTGRGTTACGTVYIVLKTLIHTFVLMYGLRRLLTLETIACVGTAGWGNLLLAGPGEAR